MNNSPQPTPPSHRSTRGRGRPKSPKTADGSISSHFEEGTAILNLVKHAIKLELLTPAQETILARQRIEADRDIELLEKTLKETKPRKGSKLYTNIQASLEQARKVKDDAVCAFMERNIRLAVKIAGDMGFLPAPLEGRVSSGLEGLRDAALRFDPDKGGKFSTYAAFWIKQRMFRDSRMESRTIRLSANMITRLSKVSRAESDLQSLYARPATDAEIAEHVGLDQKQMRAVRLAQQTMAVSLEPQAEDIDSVNYQETLADPNAQIPGTSNIASDRLHILHQALVTLNQRERTIIFDRFGLNKTGVRHTLEEVGQRYGVTRERIRQLETIALKKLRKVFEEIDTPNLVMLEAKRNHSGSQE